VGSPEISAVPAKPSWMARFGYRNVGYIAFLLLLIPFGILLESTGSHAGSDRGGGVGAAVFIGMLGSILFGVVNACLLVVAWVRSRSDRRALIGCALPAGLAMLAFLAAGLIV